MAQKESSLNDCFVCIVGQKHFQNSMMRTLLEEKTGARCCVFEELNQLLQESEFKEGGKKIVLFDFSGKGLEGCQAILKNNDCLSCIDHFALFNVDKNQEIEESTAALGACGFFYRSETSEQFVKGVKAIAEGKLWIRRDILETSFKKSNKNYSNSNKMDTILTAREKEILLLLAKGTTNREISDQLCISDHTVKTHIYKIYKKINVPNRLQASLWAIKNL